MIIRFEKRPRITHFASVGGKSERDGPLGDMLDKYDESDYFGMKTWEKAEAEMQRLALFEAMTKGNFLDSEIDMLFAGDLMNQCVSSGYGLLSFDIPFAGLYGACSTCAESIALASCMTSAYLRRCAAVTSSHFCSAERQFRYPLEYASLRTPTSQRTVTGAGAFIIESEGDGVMISEVMFGKSFDSKIKDTNNMGEAMTVAAVDTLTRFFKSSATLPSDYDAIYTGDLGYEGRALTVQGMLENGYDINDRYDDCGLLIFNRKMQDAASGGSGCGCSALVLATKILPEMLENKMKNVLFVATGALMSPSSVQQGLSIPSIAHLIHLTLEE